MKINKKRNRKGIQDSINNNILDMKNSTIMFKQRFKSNINSPRDLSSNNLSTLLNKQIKSKAHLSMSKSRRNIMPPCNIPLTTRKHLRNKSYFRLKRVKANNFLSPNSRNLQPPQKKKISINKNSIDVSNFQNFNKSKSPNKNIDQRTLSYIESKPETVIVNQNLFNKTLVSSSNNKSSGKSTSNKEGSASYYNSSESYSKNQTNNKASSRSKKSGQKSINSKQSSSRKGDLQSNEIFEKHSNDYDDN